MFGKLFGKKRSKAPTQQAPKPPTIVPLASPRPVRQNSLTDATVISHVLQQGSSNEVRDYMSRHLIQMANPAFMNDTERAAQTTATEFAIREKQENKNYRHLGGHQYRKVKTFELFPVPPSQLSEDPTIGANYFAMTGRDVAWKKDAEAEPKMGSIKYTSQTQPWAASAGFTGCLALRTEKGQLAHVQPTSTSLAKLAMSEQPSKEKRESTGIQRGASMLSSADSQKGLEQQSAVLDIFGPKDYGKFAVGTEHNRTNVMVHQTPQGDATLFYQSLFAQGNVEKKSLSGGGLTENWHIRSLTSGYSSFGSSNPPIQQPRRKSLTSMITPPTHQAPPPPTQQAQSAISKRRRSI
jgi:hypothetical protein